MEAYWETPLLDGEGGSPRIDGEAPTEEQCVAAVFRDLKIEKPDQTFLPFQCAPLSCSAAKRFLFFYFLFVHFPISCLTLIVEKRRIVIQVVPDCEGEHEMLLYNEVSMKVETHPFFVLSLEKGKELEAKRRQEEKACRLKEEKAAKDAKKKEDAKRKKRVKLVKKSVAESSQLRTQVSLRPISYFFYFFISFIILLFSDSLRTDFRESK